jgi:hypothetical protein
LFDDVAVNIGQAAFGAVVSIGELCVVDAEEMENRRVDDRVEVIGAPKMGITSRVKSTRAAISEAEAKQSVVRESSLMTGLSCAHSGDLSCHASAGHDHFTIFTSTFGSRAFTLVCVSSG